MNSVIKAEGIGPATPDFVRNRIAMQQGYLDEIRETFDGLVRAMLPLYDTEVRGVPMLERVGQDLFA